MVFSALLLSILAVNGLLAVDSNRVTNDGNESEEAVHAGGFSTEQNADAVDQNADAVDQNADAVDQNADAVDQNTDAVGIEAAKGSDADSVASLRGLSETDDVDSYVNENSPDSGQLLYAVYDYDDGANDKNVHVIDPGSLAVSPVRDASEALMRQIDEAGFRSS